MSTIDSDKAKRHFGDLINRVKYGGESVIVRRYGKPAVMVVPIEPEADTPAGQPETDNPESQW